MSRASKLLRVRFQAPGPVSAPGEEKTAWLGSKTEVCGSARASGAGSRGNDEPKVGGNRAGPESRAKRTGRSATGQGVGALTPPPRPGRRRGRAGRSAPFPGVLGALSPKSLSFPGSPTDPGRMQTDPAHGGLGDAGPAE